MSSHRDPRPGRSLDESLFTPDPAELAFFKSQTGIDDEQALKDHIISIQRKAYEIYNYGCIQDFSFTRYA